MVILVIALGLFMFIHSNNARARAKRDHFRSYKARQNEITLPPGQTKDPLTLVLDHPHSKHITNMEAARHLVGQLIGGIDDDLAVGILERNLNHAHGDLINVMNAVTHVSESAPDHRGEWIESPTVFAGHLRNLEQLCTDMEKWYMRGGRHEN